MNDRKASESNAAAQRENLAAGDDAMQDDLTEASQITPQKKEDVAQDLNMDP